MANVSICARQGWRADPVFAVFNTEGEGEMGKADVQFNYMRRRQTYNAVITTGVIKDFNLNDSGIRRIK